MEPPDKGLLEWAKESVLAIALSIGGAFAWYIRTRPKSQSIEANQGIQFAQYGLNLAKDSSDRLLADMAALRERVKELEDTVKELQEKSIAERKEWQDKWYEERILRERLATENKDLLDEVAELRKAQAG